MIEPITGTELAPIENVVLLNFRGSQAHGTVLLEGEFATDDIDLQYVVIPPLDNYFGLKEFGSRGTKEVWTGPVDAVVYEFRKFVRLMVQGNPNVLQTLWLPEKHILINSLTAQELIAKKHLFASKKVFHAFKGYAMAQMEGMKKSEFKGYMGAERKQLVTRFGFDTKHSSHLIRLLKMGIEFAETGNLTVDRSNLDAKHLTDIKTGQFSFSQIMIEAEKLFKDLEEANRASRLPEEPAIEEINRLCTNLISNYFEAQREN